MRATWRPLPAWPYPPATQRRSNFAVSWGKTLADLEKEIDDQFRLDGTPKVNFRVLHKGAEVGFDTSSGPRIFHTDAFGSLQENLRAISLGLTALRAIDRYGITTAGEQYAGFAMLPPGGPDADRGRQLVERAGGITAALKTHHPDTGGNAADFADVQAYRTAVGDLPLARGSR